MAPREHVHVGVGQEGGGGFVGGELAACCCGVRLSAGASSVLSCLFICWLASLPSVPEHLAGLVMELALDDVVVDGPPVLPVLLKETGDLKDVRHCL